VKIGLCLHPDILGEFPAGITKLADPTCKFEKIGGGWDAK